MAIKSTSILLLFLGAATLSFDAARAVYHPVTVSRTIIGSNQVAVTDQEKMLVRESYKETIGNLSKAILLGKQAKDVARKSIDSKNQAVVNECIKHIDTAIYDLGVSLQSLKTKNFIVTSAHMLGASAILAPCMYPKKFPSNLRRISKDMYKTISEVDRPFRLFTYFDF